MKKIISLLAAFSVVAGMGLSTVNAAELGIIVNTNFEEDTAGFNARGTATVVTSTDTSNSGSSCMLVSDRGANAWEGASRGITGIKLDETYKVSAYVKAATPGDSFEVKLSLELTDFNGTDYPQIASATITSDSWTLLEGTWKADYTGNLETLNLNLETSDNGIGKSFYVDDLSFASTSVKLPDVEVAPEQVIERTYSGVELAKDVVDTKYARSIEIMQILGVMDGYPDGTFKPENTVTRAEFVTMLLRLMNDSTSVMTTTEFTDVPESHFANGYIGYAVSRGLCNGYGGGLFGPDDTVTYAQAVKMLMSMMGYEQEAVQRGGYPNGYMTVAVENKIKLDDFTTDQPLTRGAVTDLFEKALDVPMYMVDYGNDKVYRDEDSTILSVFFDAEYDKGYVVSNNKSSLSGQIASQQSVVVGDEQFMTGSTRADELVGYNINYIAYQPSKGEDRVLLFVEVNDSKTTELTLDAADIESFENYRYEYDTGEGKIKDVKIDSDFNLIYNGKTVDSGYTDELMTPAIGTIRLISDGSTSSYNTVIITGYEPHVVSYVNKSQKIVHDVDKNQIDLDYESGDANIVFKDANGKELTFNDIKEDSVIHIASSLDGEEKTVVITNKKAEGIMNSRSDEEITIDGDVYELARGFIDKYELPETGNMIEAYLDMDGRVVYVEQGSATGMNVGYLMKAYTEDNGDDYIVRIFTKDGEFENYKVTDKTSIDGEKPGSKELVLDAFNTLITGKEADSNFVKASRRLVLFSTNSSDELIKVDTAYDTSDGDNTLKPLFEAASGEKFSYKQSTGTFYNTSNNHFFSLTDEAIVISVPQDESDTSEYTVKAKSSFGWNDYEIYPFKANDDNLLASICVEYDTSASSVTSDLYIITGIMDGLNKDGEEVKVLELYNGTEKTHALKEASLWRSEWDKGTVVQIAVNGNSEITAISEANTSGTIIDSYDYIGKGYIYTRDGDYGYFATGKPSETPDVSTMALIPVNKFSIIVYNKRTEECYTGTAGDIIDYESDPENYTPVYITMSYENPKTMICIVDY